MTKLHSELLRNIPPELASAKLWLQYENVPDAKHPDRKPRKRPICKYAAPEDKAANCRTLEDILTKREPKAGVQYVVQKDSGFVFIDLDGVRNPDTGDIDAWANALIEQMDSYTEISASGKGFHIVCRGSLSEDFHRDKNPIEIYSGNIENKLLAMTGDVYGLTYAVADRQQELTALLARTKGGVSPTMTAAAPLNAPIDWRKDFHTVDELADGDITWLVEKVLPEGVGFIGALSGAGKTWLALSLARALATGTKFLGNYNVPVAVPVLYLCPEMSEKAFKRRLRLFHMPNGDMFRCRTISDGIPLPLEDPRLVTAIQELKPVVFLDTAMRFSLADDENDAAQHARGMANAIFSLLHLGARAVVCLHHRSKKAGEQTEMTLENALRGTGDIGAICDMTFGVQTDRGTGGQYAKESKKLVRLAVKCCKQRDAEELDEFRVQLFPFIEKLGDFAVLEGTPEQSEQETHAAKVSKMREAIKTNRDATYSQLEELTGTAKSQIKGIAAEAGWKQISGVWQPTEEKAKEQPSLEDMKAEGLPV
ncbi:MAG: AAA family ATPase [Terriglobales bacterium]